MATGISLGMNVNDLYFNISCYSIFLSDTDTVAIGSASIKAQSIGVGSSFHGVLKGVDGALGLGPHDPTLNTLCPNSSKTIPTVTEACFSHSESRSGSLIQFQSRISSPKA
jgi:hypothetical protein